MTFKEKKVRSGSKKVRDICPPVSSSIHKSFYAIFWPLWLPISTALLRNFQFPLIPFLLRLHKTNTVSENQNQSNFICQWELKVKQANCLKRGTMWMTTSRLFYICIWLVERMVRVLGTNQKAKVSKTQATSYYFIWRSRVTPSWSESRKRTHELGTLLYTI